jgi:hypothetical protein
MGNGRPENGIGTFVETGGCVNCETKRNVKRNPVFRRRQFDSRGKLPTTAAWQPALFRVRLALLAERFARCLDAQSFDALELILRPFFELAEIRSLQRHKIQRNRPQ